VLKGNKVHWSYEFKERCYAVLSFSFFGRKMKVLAQQILFKPPFTLLSSGKAKNMLVLCTVEYCQREVLVLVTFVAKRVGACV
jgi:hypothetical protein